MRLFLVGVPSACAKSWRNPPSIARAAALSRPNGLFAVHTDYFQPIGRRPAKRREPEMPSVPSGNKLAARTVTLRSGGKAMGAV